MRTIPTHKQTSVLVQFQTIFYHLHCRRVHSRECQLHIEFEKWKIRPAEIAMCRKRKRKLAQLDNKQQSNKPQANVASSTQSLHWNMTHLTASVDKGTHKIAASMPQAVQIRVLDSWAVLRVILILHKSLGDGRLSCGGV